jgi:MoaA/NifB/PqqE/SkfB family radical SAM enzyme
MKAISLHLTDQCNNSCIFCVVNSHKEKREGVKKEILHKFLEENVGQGCESVNIHGGEATILEDFLSILDKIRSLGYPQVSLQTNARKLADPDYAQEVYNRGVKLFVVSMHGRNAAEHDEATREPGSFEQAIAGIRNVKSLGAKVRTNTVVYKGNHSVLTDIVQFILDLKVDHANLSAVHPVGKAYQNFLQVTPKYSEIRKDVFAAVDLCVQNQRVVTLEGFPNCTIPGYERYTINWEEINFKLLFHNFILNNYAVFMDKETRKQGEKCRSCIYQPKCGGVYKEYLEFYDWDDIVPVTDETSVVQV